MRQRWWWKKKKKEKMEKENRNRDSVSKKKMLKELERKPKLFYMKKNMNKGEDHRYDLLCSPDEKIEGNTLMFVSKLMFFEKFEPFRVYMFPVFTRFFPYFMHDFFEIQVNYGIQDEDVQDSSS